MRILYAGSVDLNQEKGDAIHFRSLAHALLQQEHELTIVAFGSDGAAQRHGLDQPNMSIHWISKARVPVIAKFLNDLYFWGLLLWLGFNGRRRGNPFSVIYHRGVVLANLCAQILGLPTIVEVNGIQVDEIAATGGGSRWLLPHQLRERLLVTAADRIICVTPGIQRELETRYQVLPSRCVVIENAADTERFQPQSQPAAQAAVGLNPAFFYIGFVGSFQPWVDFDCLLQTAADLRTEEQIRWTIVGDGPRFLEIQRKVWAEDLDSLIYFAGRVPHYMIPTWCNAFDLCIAPFTQNRNDKIGVSPLKLYEYMACGRPIVATALPGIIETLQASQSGYTFPPGDAAAMAQQIRELFHAPALREQMGIRGRQYVLQHHSWRSVAAQTTQIMKQICDNDTMASSRGAS